MFVDFVFVLHVELCIFIFFSIPSNLPFISTELFVSNGLKVLPVRLLMMRKVLRVPPCPLYFYFFIPKMAWLLEQSSLSGDLAIKVDLCITLAAF